MYERDAQLEVNLFYRNIPFFPNDSISIFGWVDAHFFRQNVHQIIDLIKQKGLRPLFNRFISYTTAHTSLINQRTFQNSQTQSTKAALNQLLVASYKTQLRLDLFLFVLKSYCGTKPLPVVSPIKD